MLTKNEKFKEEISRVEILVLDEADRLFEERLLPNMQNIIKEMPNLRQTMLATATIDENFNGKKLQ